MLDAAKIKKDFPIFAHDPSLVYLDSTATSLKPAVTINALRRYYEEYSANIFRGIYGISEKATAAYEATRESAASFINAKPEEVVFTRNTTESLNLICSSYAGNHIDQGDEMATSIIEHHSNFVPWQQLAINKGAILRILEVKSDGTMDPVDAAVTSKTKILAITHTSNVMGTTHDISRMAAAARKINPSIIIVVDAAQAAPHQRVDVATLGADFIAFSSHKMLGPTGVGILWGRKELLQDMQPFLYGGEMIEEVYREKSVFKRAPHKFEAGTPSIAEVIALKAAIDYLGKIGLDNIGKHERELAQRAYDRLRQEFPDIRILGPQRRQSGIVAFWFEKIHAHDIAQILSERNIAVRAGHHCAMPLHSEFAIDATVRASFYLYNDTDDIEKLVSGVRQALQILK